MRLRYSNSYLNRFPLRGTLVTWNSQQLRCIHSSKANKATESIIRPAIIPKAELWEAPLIQKSTAPLSILPIENVVRSYLVTSVFASPVLTKICFTLLSRMVQAKSSLTSIEKNPILAWILKKTFYAQFCAGEKPLEVKQTVDELRRLGYNGVVLEYALEVLKDGKGDVTADCAVTKAEIENWRKGMMQTVKLASSGDFVALKWSGLGGYALRLLKENQPPTAHMQDAIKEVCDLAHAKRVGLFAGAEEEITNVGIESWTENLQRQYNGQEPGRATVYTTFQSYLKSTPQKILQHIANARENKYTFGIKMVRGAYLRFEPLEKVLKSKEETDQAYDDIVSSLLRRKYDGLLQAPAGYDTRSFPAVDLVLASHNHESVRKARAIRDEQVLKGEQRIRLSYAQLQGMADEISCELVSSANGLQVGQDIFKDIPRAYKNACWGTQRECLEFLLRRASENKEAATRTDDSRKAMGAELRRRIKRAFGFL